MVKIWAEGCEGILFWFSQTAADTTSVCLAVACMDSWCDSLHAQEMFLLTLSDCCVNLALT